MILLTIITKTPEQSKEIVDLLLKESLVMDVLKLDNNEYYRLDESKNVIETKSSVLKCITQYNLYKNIKSLLIQKYKEKAPILYSIVIDEIIWEHA